MKLLNIIALSFFLVPTYVFAQEKVSNSDGTVIVEGTIQNDKNGNPLPDAQVVVYDDRMFQPLAQALTDGNGTYRIAVPKKDRYRVAVDKNTYFKSDKIFSSDTALMRQDLTLKNKPGYIFDITIFDKDRRQEAINSLPDCKIEIYNNTTKEQELTLPKHKKAVFNFPFNEGNHYTVLVRKPKYINRRIEAYVDINGCIMCVDGMGVEKPNMIALMSHDNEVGYFLGSIELDSLQVGKKFNIPNIYYDYDKSFIRPDAAKILDKLAIFLKDNPAIKVELGAHTDSRGSDAYNMALSGRRAESAVRYLVDICGISQNSITSKGYGETELVNSCANKIKCSEEEHQMNRRTELKITAIMEEDPLWNHTLKEIIEDKNLYQKIIKLEKAGQGQPKTGSPGGTGTSMN
jgi:outer membrane protein OmpA-like peptidoglycan-associated protein